MDTYKKPYSALFNQITNTLSVIDFTINLLEGESEKLKTAQVAVEEFVIRNDESLEEDKNEDLITDKV